MKREYFIEVRSGQAIEVKKNEKITVIDIDGTQVHPVNLFMYIKN